MPENLSELITATAALEDRVQRVDRSRPMTTDEMTDYVACGIALELALNATNPTVGDTRPEVLRAADVLDGSRQIARDHEPPEWVGTAMSVDAQTFGQN